MHAHLICRLTWWWAISIRLLENVRHRVNTPLPYLQKKTIQTFCRH